MNVRIPKNIKADDILQSLGKQEGMRILELVIGAKLMHDNPVIPITPAQVKIAKMVIGTKGGAGRSASQAMPVFRRYFRQESKAARANMMAWLNAWERENGGDVESQTCIRCANEKPRSEFPLRGRYTGICATCREENKANGRSLRRAAHLVGDVEEALPVREAVTA